MVWTEFWVDLETLGKEQRQGKMNSVKSHHCVEDIKAIAPLLNTSEMLVRINPINPNSEIEIEEVIEAGANIIMLPLWKTLEEVKAFNSLVSGRVKTTLLLETREAAECLDEVLTLGGFEEIHIGLNDLHLSYGLTFMFELLGNGTVESICNKIRSAGFEYGFGGIAKIGDGAISAEKIILEHYRLGSTRAILSRTFCDNAAVQETSEIERVFSENMKKLRDFEAYAANAGQSVYLENQAEVIESVSKIVSEMKEKRND